MAADAQKIIELVFRGVDETAAATTAAIRNAKDLSGSIADVTQPIAEFTGWALKLEAGMLAAGAAVTAFAVKTAGEFDTAFRQITTLIEEPVTQLGGFRDSILEYAATSTRPLEDITSALTAAIGSGVKWSESLDLVRVAEQLAVATRADLKGTTEVMVSTLNAYGLSTGEAKNVADLFFKVIADGKIEMDDLAASFAMVTPAAAASGVSLKEVGAVIATLTAAGVRPATAIEYLRSAISNIIKPSEQAKKMAAELGIEFDAQALKSRGLAAVLDDVGRATEGDAGKMSRLVGDVGGLTAVLTLTGAQAGKFKEELTAMGDVTGSVAEAFAKMQGDVSTSVQLIQNALTGMFIQIGTPMLDEFGGVSKAIAAIFNSIGESVKDGNLGGLVQYVEGLLGNLQTTLETVARNLPEALAQADFSGFRTGIQVVIDAITQLFGGVDLTTVEGLRKVIELTGLAFEGLGRFVAGVVTSFKPLMDALIEAGQGTEGLKANLLDTVGQIAGFATQVNLLATGVSGLIPWLEAFLGVLTARSGLGLLGAIPGVSAATGGLVAALAGPAGLAVALGAAAIGATAYAVSASETEEAQKRAAEAGELFKEKTTELNAKLAELSTSLGIPIQTYEQFDALVKAGTIVWDDAANGWAKAGTAAEQLGESAGRSWEEIDKHNQALLAASAAADKAADAQGKVKTETAAIIPIYDEATGAVIGYEQNLAKASTSTGKLATDATNATKSAKEVADAMKAAAEAQQKWNLEIEKLKAAENLKLIEAQTQITTARIEADAKVMTASFESINTTIQSTGDLIGKLTGQMSGTLEWSQIRVIEEQLEKENQRRQEALDLQKKLVEEQVRLLKARADSLERGDALIKIEGGGLQPHLEAFMWEILKTIQTRVNADGLEMLVGGT